MKIAVTGKGGVGKSTLVAMMAGILSQSGKRVILIDADPDMNAGGILGIPDPEDIQPISTLKELIAERTGTEVGKSSPLFKMNPKVDDIPEKYCRDYRGIKLLVMGTIKRGGSGCACPENTFLKTLLSHLIINRNEWVLLDMEAGIEHLGRGTAIGVDVMFIITEPSRSSVDTAHRIIHLSNDIGIKSLKIIGNKIRSPGDREYLQENLKQAEIIGFIDYSDAIRDIDFQKTTALDINGKPADQIRQLLKEEQDSSISDKPY